MLRQLESSPILGRPLPKGMRALFGGYETRSPPPRRLRPRLTQTLPRRPDASVINESIPLFYIGQNRKGRWVVRGADGQSGGLFLFKQWAVHFARRQGEPFGSAIMFLGEPIELEIDSHGKCAGSFHAMEHSLRDSQDHRNAITAVGEAWRSLKGYFSRNSAAQRRNRLAVERDLFGGQYKLASKNDDDLPIVR